VCWCVRVCVCLFALASGVGRDYDSAATTCRLEPILNKQFFFQPGELEVGRSPHHIIITTTFVLAALSYLASPSQPLPMESKRRFVLFRFSRPRAKPAQPCPYRLLVITPSRHSGLCLFLSPRAICADISAVTNLKTLLTVRLDSHRSRCPRTHLTTAVRRAGYW
jgi:hypothetical protein